MDKPEDALLEMDGSFYKIGLHRRVFIWNQGGWIKSNKAVETLFSDLVKDAERLKSRLAKAKNEIEILKAG